MSISRVKRSVALQIALWVCLSITLVTGVGLAVLDRTIQRALSEEANANLKGVARSTVDLVETYYRELESELRRMGAIYVAQYDQPFEVDTSQQLSVGTTTAPALTNGGVPLNGDYRLTDRFANATGGFVTVFVRRGTDFVRVATSLKDERGERAVGTLLEPGSAAYVRLNAGGTYFGLRNVFGKELLTWYQPLRNSSNQIIGALSVGLDSTDSLRDLRDRVHAIRLGQTGYVYILDANTGTDYGKLIVHPAKEGQNILEARDHDGRAFIREILEKRNGIIHYPWLNKELSETRPREKVVVFAHAPSFNWVVGAGSYIEEFNAVARTVRYSMIAVMAASLLASAVIIVLLARRMIGQPLAQVVGYLRELAAGNYRQSIHSERIDEIGQVISTLATTQEQVRATLADVAGSAQQVLTASRKLGESAAVVTRGSREQAEAANSVAAAIEEMTVSINLVAENAQEARAISQDSGQKSQSGASVIEQTATSIQDIATTVRDASERMQSVHQHSSEISTVVNVIKEIADQVNLLALNAAIEAARAGEQGRGFAVVADEVRKLAERTAHSTAEIVQTISAMQQVTQLATHSMDDGVRKVDAGVALAHDAAASMTAIQQGSARVVDAVHDISLALGEQGAASNMVAEQVERIARMSEQNSVAINETGTQVQTLAALADDLQRAIDRFRI